MVDCGTKVSNTQETHRPEVLCLDFMWGPRGYSLGVGEVRPEVTKAGTLEQGRSVPSPK